MFKRPLQDCVVTLSGVPDSRAHGILGRSHFLLEVRCWPIPSLIDQKVFPFYIGTHSGGLPAGFPVPIHTPYDDHEFEQTLRLGEIGRASCRERV